MLMLQSVPTNLEELFKSCVLGALSRKVCKPRLMKTQALKMLHHQSCLIHTLLLVLNEDECEVTALEKSIGAARLQIRQQPILMV